MNAVSGTKFYLILRVAVLVQEQSDPWLLGEPGGKWMPGPWHRDGGSLELKVGGFIEGGVKDDSGKNQGTVVLGILEVGGSHGGYPSIRGYFIGSSDPHYLWWMTSGEGRSHRESCWYHLCGKRPGDCAEVRKKKNMIHLTKTREVGPGDFTGATLDFQKAKALKEPFDANLESFTKA